MSQATQQATQPTYSLNLDWLAQDIKNYIEEAFKDYVKSVYDNLNNRNEGIAKDLDHIVKKVNYYIGADDQIIRTYMDRFNEINPIVGYLSAIASMITVLDGQSRGAYGQQRRMIEEEKGKLLSIFKHLLAAYHNVDVNTLSDQEVLLELRHYAALANGLSEYLKEKLKADYLRKGGKLENIEDIYRFGDTIHTLFTKLIVDSISILYERLLRDEYIGPKLVSKVVASIIKQNPDMIYNFSSRSFRDLYSKYVTPPTAPAQQPQGQQAPQQQTQQRPAGQQQQTPQPQQTPQAPSSQQPQQPSAQPQQNQGNQQQGQQSNQTQGQSQQGQQGQHHGP